MYHDEKVISGILHFRGTPDGEWTPYSHAKLTEMLMAERRVSGKVSREFADCARKYIEVSNDVCLVAVPRSLVVFTSVNVK